MLVLSLLLSQPAFAVTWEQIQATTGWSTLGTKNHPAAGTVTSYKATIAGVDCFCGAATVSGVNPDTLLEVVTDIVGAKKWSTAGVSDAAVLKRTGSVLEYYQFLDVPGWTMVSDRFWFMRGHIEKGDPTVFRWEKLDAGGDHNAKWQEVKAAHPGAVEPPTNVGAWRFTRADGGVSVEYYICTDAGGSIPVTIQNAATKKTLPDTVGDAIREAQRRTQ